MDNVIRGEEVLVLPKVWGKRPATWEARRKYPKSDSAPERAVVGPYADYPNPLEGLEEAVSRASTMVTSPMDGSLKVLLTTSLSPVPPHSHRGAVPVSGVRFLRMAQKPLSTRIHPPPPQPHDESPSLYPAFITEVGMVRERRMKGFERLETSLERLFGRLGEDDLADKWAVLSDWVDRFYNDADGKDVGNACLAALADAYECDEAKGRRHPNPALTSIACSITDRLFSLLERYLPDLSPVLSATRRELLGALYASTSTLPQSYTPAAHPADYRAKPYYTLVRDIANKIGQAEDEVQAAEIRREKQSAVLDRGIMFWQLEFQKRVLMAWRAHVAYERNEKKSTSAVAEAMEKCSELRGKLNAAESDRVQTEVAHAEEVAELQSSIKELREKIASVEERNKKISQTKDAFMITHEKVLAASQVLRDENSLLIIEATEYKTLLENMTKHCFEGPPWEVTLQEDVNKLNLGGSSATLDTDGLLEWFNFAVSRGDGGSSQHNVASFTSVLDLFNAYACVLHYMSPTHITDDDKKTVIAEIDHYQKASTVLSYATRLGIAFPFTAEDLINPRSYPQHALIISSLFQRVADPILSAACSQPPLSGEPPPHHPLWVSKPSNPEEWKARIDSAYSRSSRLRGLGAISQNIANEILIDKLNGKSLMMSEELRVQMQEFSSAPVGVKTVTSLLIKGDDDARGEQVGRIKNILTKNYKPLIKIFKFYASSDTRAKDVEISLDEMWKLTQDAKVKGLTRDKLMEAFKRSNVTETTTTKSTLNEQEYAIMLLQLANDYCKVEGSIESKLEQFISRNVVAQCSYTDAEEFQERLYGKDIQEVLRIHRGFAAQVFGYYCKQSAIANGPAKRPASMRMDTFVDLVNDLHLTDSVLTHEAVRQIFLKMQVENTDMLLEFNEFLDCLCALAAFKNPAPYLPLFKRIARFFENWFVPTLSQPHIKNFVVKK